MCLHVSWYKRRTERKKILLIKDKVHHNIYMQSDIILILISLILDHLSRWCF